MNNVIRLLIVAVSILSFTSCKENQPLKLSTFIQSEEKQTILAMSNKFNSLIRQREMVDFVRGFSKQKDKELIMMDYLASTLDLEQNKIANVIIGHLFESKRGKSLRSRENDDFFALSPLVDKLIKKLTNEMKDTMILASYANQTADQLVESLKLRVENFKDEIYKNEALTFDESRALIAFCEFETNSIGDIMSMANLLNTSNIGRTQGWFSNLIQTVVTAVVVAAVVAAAVVTAGAVAGVMAATWYGTAVGVGAMVGGVYGGVIGYDLSSRGYYFTDFDPSNIGGGFLDWELCAYNPGHWACI